MNIVKKELANKVVVKKAEYFSVSLSLSLFQPPHPILSLLQQQQMISQYYCFFQEDYAANLIEESGKNCTETHLTEGEFGTDDLHYLIDFDMAFLGDQPAAYQKHIENIRKEYAHLDDAEYNSQRLKVSLKATKVAAI